MSLRSRHLLTASRLSLSFSFSPSASSMAFAPPLSASAVRSPWVSPCTTPLSRSLCSRRSYLVTEEARIARHSVLWKSCASPSASSTQSPSPSPLSSKLLDGKATALAVRTSLREQIATFVDTHGEDHRPSLAVVLVGERPDSVTYVRSKRRVCDELGITSHYVPLPASTPEADLVTVIRDLNARSDVHGILVQLPLPKHVDEEAVLAEVSIEKDVDGFHPLNIGRLCMSGRVPPLFTPCTPRACIELLDAYDVPIDGRNAVVIGRSNIVGLPVAMMLMHRNATVSICHSKTKDIAAMCADADIVVAACGRPAFVKAEWLKPGCVVVDVGINAVDDASKKKGYRLVGDVEESARDVVSLITPVPGGVGPMTIAMLMKNTFEAATRAVQQ